MSHIIAEKLILRQTEQFSADIALACESESVEKFSNQLLCWQAIHLFPTHTCHILIYTSIFRAGSIRCRLCHFLMGDVVDSDKMLKRAKKYSAHSICRVCACIYMQVHAHKMATQYQNLGSYGHLPNPSVHRLIIVTPLFKMALNN